MKLVPLDALRNSEELSGATILGEVETYTGRFVAYPSEHARVAHTLWIAHAHLMDCWKSTPRIAFLSAERGSGKTRALEVTETLVPNPVHAVNVTPAYLFRKVGDDERRSPTILYDEVDTLFGSKMQDTGEISGLLNAGHRRGAVVRRALRHCRPKVQTEEIPAFCAVALAGLGNTCPTPSLPARFSSRCAGELLTSRLSLSGIASICHTASNLYHDLSCRADVPGSLVPSHRCAAKMPLSVNDRDADCWEPLLAIADAAGGDWPERARAAAVVRGARSAEQTQTTGVQLLQRSL